MDPEEIIPEIQLRQTITPQFAWLRVTRILAMTSGGVPPIWIERDTRSGITERWEVDMRQCRAIDPARAERYVLRWSPSLKNMICISPASNLQHQLVNQPQVVEHPHSREL